MEKKTKYTPGCQQPAILFVSLLRKIYQLNMNSQFEFFFNRKKVYQHKARVQARQGLPRQASCKARVVRSAPSSNNYRFRKKQSQNAQFRNFILRFESLQGNFLFLYIHHSFLVFINAWVAKLKPFQDIDNDCCKKKMIHTQNDNSCSRSKTKGLNLFSILLRSNAIVVVSYLHLAHCPSRNLEQFLAFTDEVDEKKSLIDLKDAISFSGFSLVPGMYPICYPGMITLLMPLTYS